MIRLIEDKLRKGYFYASLEINNITFNSEIVKTKPDWIAFSKINNLKFE